MTTVDLFAAGIAVIERCQHSSGGYVASPDYPSYRYCWLRDGSFTADAMSRVGRVESADAFYRWYARVVRERRTHIRDIVARAGRGVRVVDAELLPTRYELDGSDGVEPWADFQTDGYGTLLFTLFAHLRRHGLAADAYRDVIAATVDYLVAFGQRPCFDWWEESAERRHTSTMVAVLAGLRAAAASGVLDDARADRAVTVAGELEAVVLGDARRAGFLTKWIGGDEVDGSLLSCVEPFGLLTPSDPLAVATIAKIRTDIVRDGVYRYRGDTFYGGGEWPILTAWLGWVEASGGDLASARRRLDWIEAQALADGSLPEQVATHAQAPEFVGEWERRWGPVATPLVWSHAMYLTLRTVVTTSA
jgi:GH15 family glucan-1,4-alpha-glucosidase